MIGIAVNCADFITSHVGNFLDIAKLKTSSITLTKKPVEVVDLIKKIVDMHKFKAESKNMYLKMNASQNMPDLAMMDSNRFTQVMVNLISNSLKFTESGGVTVNMYFKETDRVDDAD
jgi:signal transduction histidine kinase